MGTQHPISTLPSDTYDGPLPHDNEVTTDVCPRCVADRAVLSTLEGK